MVLRLLTFMPMSQICASGVVFPLATSPGFFQYGLGFPFYHHARVMKHITFGSLWNEVWESVGVILAYVIFGSGAQLSVCCFRC